jgi:hypothetical protein
MAESNKNIIIFSLSHCHFCFKLKKTFIHILIVSRAVCISISLYCFIDYMKTKSRTNQNSFWTALKDSRCINVKVGIAVSSANTIVSVFSSKVSVDNYHHVYSIRQSFWNSDVCNVNVQWNREIRVFLSMAVIWMWFSGRIIYGNSS